MKIVIDRNRETKTQTEGNLAIYNDKGVNIFNCYTLELPWRNNKNGVSRIPSNTYEVVKYNSPSKGEVFLLKDVPNRHYIEIHAGNFAYNKKLVNTVVYVKGESKKDTLKRGGIIDSKLGFYDLELIENEVRIYNTMGDILGCILVGESFIDIDGDNVKDVTNSRKTMKKLYNILPNTFKIEIYDCF